MTNNWICSLDEHMLHIDYSELDAACIELISAIQAAGFTCNPAHCSKFERDGQIVIRSSIVTRFPEESSADRFVVELNAGQWAFCRQNEPGACIQPDVILSSGNTSDIASTLARYVREWE